MQFILNDLLFILSKISEPVFSLTKGTNKQTRAESARNCQKNLGIIIDVVTVRTWMD